MPASYFARPLAALRGASLDQVRGMICVVCVYNRWGIDFPPSAPSSSAVSAAISYDYIALLLSIFELLHRARTFLVVKQPHLDLPCSDLDYYTPHTSSYTLLTLIDPTIHIITFI